MPEWGMLRESVFSQENNVDPVHAQYKMAINSALLKRSKRFAILDTLSSLVLTAQLAVDIPQYQEWTGGQHSRLLALGGS